MGGGGSGIQETGDRIQEGDGRDVGRMGRIGRIGRIGQWGMVWRRSFMLNSDS